MTLIWLAILAFSFYHIGKHRVNKRKSATIVRTNSRIRTKREQREREWEELLAKIRENRRRREAGEKIEVDPEHEDPAKRMYARELEKMMKPGFKDDPEWQRKSRELNETIERNRRRERAKLERSE